MPSLIPRTFARKVQVYIGAVACSVLAVTVWLNYSASRTALEAQTNEEALKQVKSAYDRCASPRDRSQTRSWRRAVSRTAAERWCRLSLTASSEC